MCIYVYTYIHINYTYTHSLPKIPCPPPLSRHRYDIFSGAVHIKLPYEALTIFHTAGSVVGVGVEIMVLTHICICVNTLQGPAEERRALKMALSSSPRFEPRLFIIYEYVYIYIHKYVCVYIYIYIYT